MKYRSPDDYTENYGTVLNNLFMPQMAKQLSGDLRMNNLKRIIASITTLAAFSSLCVSCDKSKKNDSTASPTTEAGTAETTEAADLHKMDITWLADYDLNPDEGEQTRAALNLYEKVYGGKINYVYTSHKERYENLDRMLAADEDVDMLPFDMHDFPNGTLKNRYQPLDPYFDKMEMDSDIWTDMKSAIDVFAYDKQHYVIPYSVSEPIFLTYSRKITEGESLGDPYTLYKEGKWDWKAFTEMMNKFVGNGNGTRYGIQGVFGETAIYSTGQTIVRHEGGKLVNNIGSPEIGKAAEMLRGLSDSRLYYNPKDFPSNFPSNHSTLFYAMSDWALGASNGENRDMDLMVVPFPKAEGSDKNYFSGTYNAVMLAAGSEKGEAVAAYIRCERLAATSQKMIDAEKKEALEVKNNVDGNSLSFITEEQYDAISEFKDLSKFTPIFDFGLGMGEKMWGYGEYSYETRGVINNITAAMLDETDKAESWQAFAESAKPLIDSEITKYNK